jgi:hypothetical protein
MSQQDDYGEGPLFPIDRLHVGITIRDYLAALAMQAYCSDPSMRQRTDQQGTAQLAYTMADIMLAARTNGQK